ncbi:glycosyltransferase family A protein [Larkinella soli]|uniref:glycosyltransferase family A protein n=1 Tax=Larkinella soli TaxID=1770527 RepID=UPI000FFBFDA4|nr:glycosyltransferase family A protein [Larkinella soli]
MDYVIITPVRNEAERVETTLRSVVSQTLRPVQWIIVDDQSTDGTADIVRRYLPDHPWIRLEAAPDMPRNDYSSRVVQLVNYGLKKLEKEAEIIVKLDGDVQFSPDFFARILGDFERNPQLGIASGLLTINGIREKFDISTGNTRGATKCYRKTCLTDIGGLYPYTSWDTIDNAAARAKGWETRILPYEFEHLKPEGSKAGSKLYNHYRTGLANGRIPYVGSYFFIKAFSKLLESPLFLAPFVQSWGYIKTRFIRRERPFPSYITAQIRKEQRAYLRRRLIGKP